MKLSKPIRRESSKTLMKEYRKRLGKMIMLIAQNLAKKWNFSRYSWIDEMISDGVLRSIEVFDNFDPDKSNNPFWYFSMVINRVFIQRLKKEKHYYEGNKSLLMTTQLYTLQEWDSSKLTVDDIMRNFDFNMKE